ncbi:MAG: thiamine phosphate synthase [Oscillospiraceae bacterium]
MKFTKECLQLYAVTDRMWTNRQTLLEQVECAIKGGVTCVQLREKKLNAEDFLQEAIAMKALCSRYGVPLLINDNVEIALKSGADGVHVGQNDMNPHEVRQILGEDKIIGVTAKTLEQALTAQEDGANYLGVGAVFATSTKTDTRQIDDAVFREICDTVKIPVVAIGGINQENMSQLKGWGMDGFALVSAIFSAQDIETRCRELLTKAKEIL